MNYVSFTNRGIQVFTSGNVNRKEYRKARRFRQCHAPNRKPQTPVPEFGI